MKRIIIYRVVAVAVLLMAAPEVRAEIVGIKDSSECAALVQNRTELLDALSNLSPTSQQASKFFQADRSRFVFCIDPDTQKVKYTVIQQQTTLANATAYPVIIYGLTLDSSLANPGQPLLTTTGTGEIAFQNLKADGLRAPILLQGKTTVLESTVSCDAANTAAAFVVSSDKNTFRKVKVNECAHGLDVAGNYNNFYEVAIQKVAAAVDQVGEWGVTVSGKLNRIMALRVSNYQVGVNLIGENNKISSVAAVEGTPGAKKTITGQWVLPSVLSGFSADGPIDNSAGVVFRAAGILETSEVTGFKVGASVLANGVSIKQNIALGGTSGAVLIGRNSGGTAYAPTLVTGNHYTTANTIAYAEVEDAKARTLLSVEWMGKHVPEGADYADRIVGKLLDQSNTSTTVELGVNESPVNTQYKLNYSQICNVGVAKDKIIISFKSKDGMAVEKEILPGEKFFSCSTGTDGSAVKIPLTHKVRFISNTPTVSVMSEDVAVGDLGDDKQVTVLILPGQVVSGEGGGLTDVGGAAAAMQSDVGGGSNETESAGAGMGSDAKIPDTTPMIGEAEAESGGGSAMSSGAMVLAGDAMPSAMGASAGCGGQMMPGIPAAPGVMLWWMAPVVALCYGRRKFKQGVS